MSGVERGVMKKLIVICLGLAAAVSPLLAQENTPPKPRKMDNSSPPGAMLTPDERGRLDAAREKAKEDPTVRSLHEAKEKVSEQLDDAMRAAMLAADPSLAPTLEKIKKARTWARDVRHEFDSLTPAQREQLKAARSAAKDDPAVKAAEEKVRVAQGPEDRRAAMKEAHKAMKAAMLKADPSVGSLLEKMPPPMRGRRGPGGDGPKGSPHGGPGDRDAGGPPPGEPGEE